MQQNKTPTLATIFSDILADLAYMFSDDMEAEPTAGSLWYETTIEYDGPVSGTLKFECSEDFATVLAANLLGLDTNDEDAENKSRDAVKEFMNIICGQYVTSVHGTNDVFNLTIPVIKELSETPDFEEVEESDNLATFSVSGHAIKLEYFPR